AVARGRQYRIARERRQRRCGRHRRRQNRRPLSKRQRRANQARLNMGIFDIFTTDAQDKAAADQIASLNTAQAQGSANLNQGLDLATNSYTAGIAPFLDLSKTATSGENAYADATGANGAAGNTRAVANFQSNPGYQYTVDQAI